MQELNHIFEGVKDPRRSIVTTHDLCEMAVIGLLCAVRGGEGCVDMARFGRSKLEFPRRFMELEHGIPNHDDFSDLFNVLDPGGIHGTLPGLVSGWGERLKGDAVAIYGKAIRRSFKDATSHSPLHLSRLRRTVPPSRRAGSRRRGIERDRGDAEASGASRRRGTHCSSGRDAHAARDRRGGRARRRRLRSGAEGQLGEAARRGPVSFRGSRQRGKNAFIHGLGQEPRSHRDAQGNGLPRCPSTSGSTPLARAGGRREGRGDARDQGRAVNRDALLPPRFEDGSRAASRDGSRVPGRRELAPLGA